MQMEDEVIQEKEHIICSKHKKPIVYLCIEEDDENVFMCRDCAMMVKDYTKKLITIEELNSKEEGKIITNWPIFNKPNLIQDYHKHYELINSNYKEQFSSLRSLFEEKMQQAEENVFAQLTEINENFQASYSLMAKKKRLINFYQNGKKQDLIKLKNQAYKDAQTNTDDIKYYLNQFKTLGVSDIIKKVSKDITSQFSELANLKVNQCSIQINDEAPNMIESVIDNIDKFIKTMNELLTSSFEIAQKQVKSVIQLCFI